MQRKCLDCGESLTGRADKKFCSDICRNNYNNRNNSDVNNHMRNINNILRKNRRLLADLAPEGKATISKQRLQDAGYNFNYHTHTYMTQKGGIYHFCYEYGYISISDDFVTIVCREKKLDTKIHEASLPENKSERQA